MLAVLFKLFGTSVVMAQLFNLACSLVIAWLTMDLRDGFPLCRCRARRLVSTSCLPNSIGYVPLILTEVYYTMLLLAGCWLLVSFESDFTLLVGGLSLD